MSEYAWPGDGAHLSPAEKQYGEGHYNLDIRWLAYEKYAQKKVNFYVEAFGKILDLASLGPDDTIYDIGCGDGRRVNEAAESLGIRSALVGSDPYDQAYTDKLHLAGPYGDNFRFVKAPAENLQLPDNSAKVAMMMFSAYEIKERSDLLRALDGVKSVVEPDGLILFGTNGKLNKPRQRADEDLLTQYFGAQGLLDAPAAPFYAEDIPSILDESGGFEIIDNGFTDQSVNQECEIHWTSQAYAHYKMTLETRVYSVKKFIIPGRWSDAIDELIKPTYDNEIEAMRLANIASGTTQEPYVTDKAARYLAVCRNIK